MLLLEASQHVGLGRPYHWPYTSAQYYWVSTPFWLTPSHKCAGTQASSFLRLISEWSCNATADMHSM